MAACFLTVPGAVEVYDRLIAEMDATRPESVGRMW